MKLRSANLEIFEQDLTDLSRKNADLVVKIAELNSNADDWRKKVAEAEVNAEAADKKLTENKEHIQALERISIELRESKQHVMLELEDLKLNCENLKSANEKAVFELEETKKTIQILEKQVLDLRQPFDESSRNGSEIGDVRERALVSVLLSDLCCSPSSSPTHAVLTHF
jgi:chromosome segregation ATPase